MKPEHPDYRSCDPVVERSPASRLKKRGEVSETLINKWFRSNEIIPDFAAEYRKVYPNDVDHFIRLTAERISIVETLGVLERGYEAFSDEDFLPDLLAMRWKTSDPQSLKAFLGRKKLKDGDIFDCNVVPYLSDCAGNNDVMVNYQQVFRNTPSVPLGYEFGKTYVGIGFVDLSQLLWGEYQNEGGTLRFYGYDQAEVTVGRSVLMYEMMKAEEREVSEKTILQVWFSSCWDRETQEQFFSFLDKHVPKINNHLLSKYAPIWKAKKGMTAKQAQHAFQEKIRSVDFVTLSNLRKKQDRVAYARFLFTGYVSWEGLEALDDLEAVCANVTMFPGHDEDWCKAKFENFYATIDMTKLSPMIRASDSSIISFLLGATMERFNRLRNWVQEEKVVCELQLKSVKLDDAKFAQMIGQLNPYLIDWSNIPDYLPRLDFIDYAMKCSGPDTVHNFHTMNWVYYVFGSVYLDFMGRRELLESIYQSYRSALQARAKAREWCIPHFCRLVRHPALSLPSNEFTTMSIGKYGDKYLRHFLTDRNGKVANHVKSVELQPHQVFANCSSTIFCAFSFDDEIVFCNYRM